MCLHVIECSSTTTAALQTKAIKRVKGDDWVEIHELATCILLQFLINSERKKRNRHCLIRRPYPAYHGSRKGTPRCCVKRARKAFYLRFVLCSFIFRFSFFFPMAARAIDRVSYSVTWLARTTGMFFFSLQIYPAHVRLNFYIAIHLFIRKRKWIVILAAVANHSTLDRHLASIGVRT